MFESCKGRRILFVTTKNLDYIRNVQEINSLRIAANSVVVIGSKRRSYFQRLIYVYLKLLFMPMKSFDAIFIGFSPQLVLPVFYWRFRNKFIVEDFFISLYDTFVSDRKKFKDDSLMSRILRRIDKKTIKYGDIIISDTKADAEYFSKQFRISISRIYVLYLEADKTIYYPRKKEKNQSARFKVLYFGSILPLQGFDTILGCIKLMKECKDICFEIIGPVDKNAQTCLCRNVKFIPWLRQTELAEHIAAADLCLAGHFNARIEKASRTIPGKAFIFEAMEKPMILGDNCANREVFHEDDRHFFVEMGNAEMLKEKILAVSEKLGFKLGG